MDRVDSAGIRLLVLCVRFQIVMGKASGGQLHSVKDRLKLEETVIFLDEYLLSVHVDRVILSRSLLCFQIPECPTHP